MKRIATILGFALLALFGTAWPSLAKVRVPQGVSVDGRPVVVTSQREVYAIDSPGAPARRLGRLPRRSSPLISSGGDAWAVRTGRHGGEEIRLYHVAPASGRVQTITPRSSSLPAPIRVEGVAGADAGFVYLLPDGRYDRQREELQPGHLDDHPDLQLLQVRASGGRAWYLARDREPDADGVVHLWLLHRSARNGDGLRVMAGVEEGPVSLSFEDRNLFLVLPTSRVLRFDSASLRLLEDLSPMLHDERILFFSADDRYYWVGTERSLPKDDAVGEDDFGQASDRAGTAGRPRRVLWRIDRDTLDGGVFHAGALPEGFALLGSDGDDLWFGATDRSDSNPVLAVDKADGSARSYSVRGRHARFWRAFGRGARDAGEGAAIVAIAIPVAVIAIVTFPFWIWAV